MDKETLFRLKYSATILPDLRGHVAPYEKGSLEYLGLSAVRLALFFRKPLDLDVDLLSFLNKTSLKYPSLTKREEYILQLRPDLLDAFNINEEAGLNRYLNWLQVHGVVECPEFNSTSKEKPLTSLKHFKPGVNLIGVYNGVLGIGEDLRTVERCLQLSDIPYSIYNFPDQISSDKLDSPTAAKVLNSLPHSINLFVLPVMEILRFFWRYHDKVDSQQTSIAYAPWELPFMTKEHEMIFDLVDEYWASSTFIRNSIPTEHQNKSRLMPLAFVNNSNKTEEKEKKSVFRFLIVFDSLSFVERKNPKSAIKAFLEEFNDEPVELVIKSMHMQHKEPDLYQEIKLLTNSHPIKIIDYTLTEQEMGTLISDADVLVSAHRSEGFGRLIIEAMQKRTLCLVSNFSGNTDFCTPETAILIEGKTIPVGDNYHCSDERQYWFDPDFESIKAGLRHCFSHFEDLKAVTHNAYKLAQDYNVENRAPLLKQALLEKLEPPKLIEYSPKPLNTSAQNTKAIVYHLYFSELVLEAIETVNNFGADYDKIFTISESMPSKYVELIKQSTTAKIFIVRNIGRDIYPFWLLTTEGFLDQYKLICKLHGKKSVHRTDGDHWRKKSISILAGSSEKIEFFEEVLQNGKNENIGFISPLLEQTLTQTEDKHWLGNLKWLKRVSSKLGYELKLADVSGLPIMSGSFYWLNQKGLERFKTLPITNRDWERSEGEKSAHTVDGALEHCIERCLLLQKPFSPNITAGFIDELGNSRTFPIRLRNRNSKPSHLTVRGRKLIQAHTPYAEAIYDENLIGSYSVENLRGKTVISGFILDLNNPSRRLTISIYSKFLPLISKIANEKSEIPSIKDVSLSNYGFSFNIMEDIDARYISIFEEETGIVLSNKQIFSIEDITSLLLLNRTPSSTLSFPEAVRRTPVSPSQFLINTKFITTPYLDQYKKHALEIDQENIQLEDSSASLKHVFIVNNPIAEIAVNRTIEELNLGHDEVLIILHRISTTSPLLEDFDQVSTNLHDVETIFSKQDLNKVLESNNSILQRIGNNYFNLYAHHYNAVFSYTLGMHPACLKVNLVEEGNLSSVSNWEVEHLSKMLQYTNLKALLDTENPLNYTNSILQLTAPGEFELMNLTTLTKHYPDDISSRNKIINTCNNLFNTVFEPFNTHQFSHLLLFRRYYLWHPKMINNVELYSVSKAFSGMYGCRSLTTPSKKENELQHIYKDLLSDADTLILLPSKASFHSLVSRIKPSDSKFDAMFKSSTSKGNTYYILHPADRINVETINAAKSELEKYPVVQLLGATDLLEVTGASPITELVATCFKYVVHYGSSLSLVLSQYECDTKEVFYNTFS